MNIAEYSIEHTGEKLETTFRQIQLERMDGVPVINKQLNVSAIGFQHWEHYQLGVLVTPWFMNLLLLPAPEQTWNGPEVGQVQVHVFPSGSYEFVMGYEKGIGFYQSCSLFSPMFEFQNQEAAEETAREVLNALMDEVNQDIGSQQRSKEIEQIWKGEIIASDVMDKEGNQELDSRKKSPPQRPERKSLSERMKEPTSRRDFLRGKFFAVERPLQETNE